MTDPQVPGAAAAVPGAAGVSADAGVPTAAAVSSDAAGDVSLLALVDRLAALLERSDLTELEVEAGGTALILRKTAALAPLATTASASPGGDPGQHAGVAAGTERPAAGTSGVAGRSSGAASSAASSAIAASGAAANAHLAVRAPLTGIFYSAPGPGSPPFVAVGREVVIGQVIGLIEAMKLFNEIKSDQAGRVVRVIAEDGALVKARQPLIEVGPL
jgi:acetyl-CoA carboxylase biotin carboxyl carrier protein